MTDIPVRVAREEEADACFATLLLAFASDPPTRWVFPRAADHLDLYKAFAKAFGGRAFAQGTALVAGEIEAVALWLPPGVTPDNEAFGPILEEASARSGKGDPGIGEQMRSFHPTTSHWYLPLIGVDPGRQGKGLGSALLARGLERVDAEHEVAYLESSNIKNVPLYERFGFEVQGIVEAPGFPPLYPMLRKAR